MRVGLTLKPGQRGTKRLVRQYGDALVCVRYRYDPLEKRRWKTVELVVDVQPWEPARERIAPATLVAVRIAYREAALRSAAKAAGARWDPALKLWVLRYDQAVALNLVDRIVPDAL